MLRRISPLLIAFQFFSCATAERKLSSIQAPDDAFDPIPAECYSNTLGGETPENWTVRNHALSENQKKNLRWIKRCALPFLPGNIDHQTEIAAKAAWWALREGILSRAPNQIFGFSNCHENGEDQIRTSRPLYVCPDPKQAWQVGIAAAQVPNYSLQTIHETRSQLFPGFSASTPDEPFLLKWTAGLAGHTEGTKNQDAILKSTGRLKRSWLLRNPLIGLVLVAENEVQKECIEDHRPWCFKGSHPEAKAFSGNKKGMLDAIQDLKQIFASP